MPTPTASKVVDLTDVDGKAVQIPKDVLDEGGWIPEFDADEYCDHDEDRAYGDGRLEGLEQGRRDAYVETSPSQQVLVEWHNEHHEGVYRFCYEQPCKGLRDAAE